MFCGNQHTPARYLIAGPRVRICDECVTSCRALAHDADSKGATSSFQPCGATPPDIGEDVGGARDSGHCSFCSKARADVALLVVGYHRQICDECLNLCRGIIEEESAERPK